MFRLLHRVRRSSVCRENFENSNKGRTIRKLTRGGGGGGGAGEEQKKYSRKGKLNEKTFMHAH